VTSLAKKYTVRLILVAVKERCRGQKHKIGMHRPVAGGGAGSSTSPQNFWKLKNITINVPKIVYN